METMPTRAQEQWLREFGPSSGNRLSFASERERDRRFRELHLNGTRMDV